MATKEIKMKGKAAWVRHKKPDEKYNKWSHQFHPDAEALEIIRDLQSKGLKNRLKKNEEGYYTNFGRPSVRERRGVKEYLDPPKVLNVDGSEFDGFVGDGSDVEITLEVYDHAVPGGGRGIAARWVDMTVLSAVPYTAPEPSKPKTYF